ESVGADGERCAVELDQTHLRYRVERLQCRGTGRGALRVDEDGPGSGLVDRDRVEERAVGARVDARVLRAVGAHECEHDGRARWTERRAGDLRGDDLTEAAVE